MATAVEEHVNVLLAVTANDHRVITHKGRLVRADIWDLALVRNPHPGFGEDSVHFGFENLRIRIEILMHLVFLDQAADIDALTLARISLRHLFCFLANMLRKSALEPPSVRNRQIVGGIPRMLDGTTEQGFSLELGDLPGPAFLAEHNAQPGAAEL